MPTCPNGKATVGGICPPSQNIDIHCIPATDGEPQYVPAPDMLPFAIEEHECRGDILWFHTCESGWIPFDNSLCRLDPIDVQTLDNICVDLEIPAKFTKDGECAEGHITFMEMAEAVIACTETISDTVSIVVGGANITVTSNTVDNVTTYTVNGTVVNTDTITILQAGENVTLDINTVGDTTTYTINAPDIVTTLVDNGDGTWTYTNEEGTPVVFQSTVTLQEGLAIDIQGTGLSSDPYIISIDLCELPMLTQQEVNDATLVMVAACVDGQSVLIPQPALNFLPTATVSLVSNTLCSAVQFSLGGFNNANCDDTTMNESAWVLKDGSGTIILSNTVVTPTLPYTETVDLCLETGPFTVEHLVTDDCGTGGAFGTPNPAILGPFHAAQTCVAIVDPSGVTRSFAGFSADIAAASIYIDDVPGGTHISGPHTSLAALEAAIGSIYGAPTNISDDGSGGAQACFSTTPGSLNPVPTSFELIETYTHTGASQNANAPTWATDLFMELWGAGGGGGDDLGFVPVQPNGAAGGAARGTMTAQNVTVVVGGRGLSSGTGSIRLGGFGGGGDGGDGAATGNNASGGSGGGYTGIFTGAINQGNARLIAGGGGGGCTGSQNATVDTAGNGGGITGEDALHSPAGTLGGGGGSQVAGGAGINAGTNGTALQGGSGGGGTQTGGSGGGGGGGYFGGGGGSGDDDPTGNNTVNRDSCGGGGSNYNSGTVSGAVHTRGNNLSAPETGRVNYINPLGDGGAPGLNGQHGLAVLTWLEN